MSNATPSRGGQINGSGDATALFLKTWSGEVLSAFENECVMKPRVKTRNISSGKSAQFPSIGTTVAHYHTPGAEITGNVLLHGEKIITVDGMLVADAFVPEIDEAMSHFEYRGPYSKACGTALAQAWDRQVLSLAVKAARDTTGSGLGVGVSGQFNASSVDIGATPTVQNIVDGFYAAAAAFDQKNQGPERWAVVSPATYWSIVTNDKIMNKFYSPNSGSYADGMLPNIAGFSIIKSNNLQIDHTANTALYPDYSSKYLVDATDTIGMLFNSDALGTLILKDLSTRVDYDPRRLGSLIVSKYAVGHGVLQPQGLYELRKT